MDIVIAGAGDVGLHLAKMLSAENHDIILIDEDEEHLTHANSHFEIMTKVGSCSSLQDLMEAGVQKTQLFISVTQSEETNITAAILAKKLGAKRVVARIDNQEYLDSANRSFLDNLGIDAFVYPEKLAAEEIVSSLKITGGHLVHEFSEGKLVLFRLKVQSGSILLDKTLYEAKELTKNKSYRTIAIKREGKTIIPRGHNRFRLHDTLFVISSPEGLSEVIELCGCKQFDLKNIMILGGSRIGQKTAVALQHKYNVKLVEIDKEKSFLLADKLSKTLVVNGDGRNLELLKEEGVEKMDVFIAVTGNSETNILSSLLAKTVGVKQTIAEVENIDFIDLAEKIGVGTMINKKLISASYIYQFTTSSDVMHFKQLTDNDAEVVELVAKENSPITKSVIKDLGFPKDSTIGGIIRDGEGIIAYGNTRIKASDKVVVFTMPHAIKKVEKFFN